jgi:hypothetical protein
MIAEQLNIGFISPGPATWPHYDSFMALIPEFVTFDFQGLGLYGKSLYEITGKRAEIVSRISDLAIASNPAMLWNILSQLGRRAAISGYGKLPAEWPAIEPEGRS